MALTVASPPLPPLLPTSVGNVTAPIVVLKLVPCTSLNSGEVLKNAELIKDKNVIVGTCDVLMIFTLGQGGCGEGDCTTR